jgi:Fe-S cluster assembly protein SufD
LTCNTLRLRLEAGSQLVHTRLQQAPSSSLLYETVAARLAERATYRLRQLSASAANARSSVQVQLQGRESAVEIQAIAAAQGSHSADTLYTTLHEAPGTRSELLFRGIASERAHAACSADVLTINTDDIQAAHGATTGQLDETLLFYLLSRGLAPEAARSLLKWAFLSEAMGQVGPAALRKRAESAIASRLSDAPAAELLR